MMHTEKPFVLSSYSNNEFRKASILNGELNNKSDNLREVARKNIVRRQKSLSQAKKSNKF